MTLCKSLSTEADVVTQVRKGTALDVLSENESWVKVRLAHGGGGAVRRLRFRGEEVGRGRKKGAVRRTRTTRSPRRRCRRSPTADGIVVVEAHVNASGNVTKTRVVSNGTGDETLAFLAEKEIKAAKFSPPIRNCVPRALIFTPDGNCSVPAGLSRGQVGLCVASFISKCPVGANNRTFSPNDPVGV